MGILESFNNLGRENGENGQDPKETSDVMNPEEWAKMTEAQQLAHTLELMVKHTNERVKISDRFWREHQYGRKK